MPTIDGGFQLGLLPEKKWNWRTFLCELRDSRRLRSASDCDRIMTSDTLLSAVNITSPNSCRRRRWTGAAAQAKALPVRAKLLPPEPVFEKRS